MALYFYFKNVEFPRIFTPQSDFKTPSKMLQCELQVYMKI